MNIITMIKLIDNKSFQGFIYQDQFSRRFVFNYFNDETNKWETQGIEYFKPNNGKNEYMWTNDPFNVYYGTTEIKGHLINEGNNQSSIISSQSEVLSPDQLT